MGKQARRRQGHLPWPPSQTTVQNSATSTDASRRCTTFGRMDDGVRAFMRAMDDGFPAVETMSAPEARAVIVGRRLPIENLDDVAGAGDPLAGGWAGGG